MRWHFLLDENMSPRGLLNRVARDVWLNIGKNDHRIIASWELYQKYWEKLQLNRKKASSEAEYAAMARIITQIKYDPERVIWAEPELAPSPFARYVRHRNDHFLADIAYQVVTAGLAPNLIFVATDARTRADFNRPELQAYNIQGVKIEEALRLARQSS